MKYFYLCLVVFFVFGCSESDKQQVIDVLPLGGVPDDDYAGGYSDGSFDIPHNPYSGSIKGYRWDDPKLGIAFREPDDYPYGFDRSTKADVSPEQDRFVYISTKNGESAFFEPVLYSSSSSETAFDSYKLVNDLDGVEYPVEYGHYVYIPKGDYSLLGFNGIEWVDLDKHIKVLSYAPKTKQIYYVQLDGDGWNTADDEFSFTKGRVEKAFRDVYGQVIMEPDIIQRDPTFYNKPDVGLDLSKILQINMISPNQLILSYVNNIARSNLLSQVSGKDVKKIDVDVLTERHVVIAVNKAMKYWPLESIYGSSGDLANLKNHRFKPEEEPAGTTYAIQSIGECEDGVGEKGIGVTIRRIVSDDHTVQYYAYHNGKKVSFGPCDYLYTTNGIPVIPYEDPTTLAVSSRFQKDGFVLGSIVWVPRGTSESSMYTMMHELGHSFGLTDVSHGDEKNYVTKEKNVMTWQAPSGKKLRYRPQQVVYTGGTPDVKECIIDDVFENQWSCLRDECNSYEHWQSENLIRKYWDNIGVEKCGEKP